MDRNGRPHQSHSVDAPGFLPPHPGHTEIDSSGAGGTVGVFYTSRLSPITNHHLSPSVDGVLPGGATLLSGGAILLRGRGANPFAGPTRA